MSNLNANAFPIFNAEGSHSSYCEGMSKHEYAAIMIAQGLAAKYVMSTPEDQKVIAQMAYELSGEVLEQFNK